MTRSVRNSKIKYDRRFSVLDTIGLDPEHARKMGIEIEGWDAPIQQEDPLSE